MTSRSTGPTVMMSEGETAASSGPPPASRWPPRPTRSATSSSSAASSPACAGAPSASRCWSLPQPRGQPVVLLGALLADVPYTRPLPVSGSAPRELAPVDAPSSAHPLRGPDRHRRRPARRLRARRARRGLVLGARAALREQPALPEGHPRPAAPRRGGPRPAGAHGDLAKESAEWEERLARPPSRTPSSPSMSESWRNASGDDGLQPLSGDEIAQEFEKYLRRRGGQAGPRHRRLVARPSLPTACARQPVPVLPPPAPGRPSLPSATGLLAGRPFRPPPQSGSDPGLTATPRQPPPDWQIIRMTPVRRGRAPWLPSATGQALAAFPATFAYSYAAATCGRDKPAA